MKMFVENKIGLHEWLPMSDLPKEANEYDMIALKPRHRLGLEVAYFCKNANKWLIDGCCKINADYYECWMHIPDYPEIIDDKKY